VTARSASIALTNTRLPFEYFYTNDNISGLEQPISSTSTTKISSTSRRSDLLLSPEGGEDCGYTFSSPPLHFTGIQNTLVQRIVARQKQTHTTRDDAKPFFPITRRLYSHLLLKSLNHNISVACTLPVPVAHKRAAAEGLSNFSLSLSQHQGVWVYR